MLLNVIFMTETDFNLIFIEIILIYLIEKVMLHELRIERNITKGAQGL